jgi:hypothetical protein
MPLTIVNDAPGKGVYIGGFEIAPEGYLVLADSFQSAWDALVERMADEGSLAAADLDGCGDDGVDFVDGHGPMVTLDVVLACVRPAGPS